MVDVNISMCFALITKGNNYDFISIPGSYLSGWNSHEKRKFCPLRFTVSVKWGEEEKSRDASLQSCPFTIKMHHTVFMVRRSSYGPYAQLILIAISAKTHGVRWRRVDADAK